MVLESNGLRVLVPFNQQVKSDEDKRSREEAVRNILQEGYKSVTRVLQECYKSVTESYKEGRVFVPFN